MLHGKQVHLGHYSDEKQAARVTDTAKIYLVRSYKQAALTAFDSNLCMEALLAAFILIAIQK